MSEVLYALSLSVINLAAALVIARYAVRQHTMEMFFRWVVGGMIGRGVVVLGAFAYMVLALGLDKFTFGLAFIAGYALMLAAEVLLLHTSLAKHSAVLRSQVPPKAEQQP
jgi:hypothetical protein